MTDVILVLNAGSSSLKYAAYDVTDSGKDSLLHGTVEVPPGDDTRSNAVANVVQQCREQRLIPIAAGHRVVHGGMHFTGPVRITSEVFGELESLIPLAPLHQPQSLAAIRAVTAVDPALPQVACFDTAFHRTQPEVAQRFAIPRKYHDQGIRRYGFHGLSYESIASTLPEIDPRAATGRTVVAHLGNGASLCAMQAGRSVATTMGFTPADGLMMGTRCGSIDPGVLVYLMEHEGMDAKAVEHLIDRESGLLGVSGLSSDMRTLQASPAPEAAEAIQLFVYRIVREIGSMAAALGGLDALVFTGGIGEHSAAIRESVCRGCEWLGVRIDADANRTHAPRISRPDSVVNAWVIPTREEWMIAQHSKGVLGIPG